MNRLSLCMISRFVNFGKLSLRAGVQILLSGFQYDLLFALCYLASPWMVFTLEAQQRIARKTGCILLNLRIYLVLLFLPIIVMMEMVFTTSFSYVMKYIAFECIIYPREVYRDIWNHFQAWISCVEF